MKPEETTKGKKKHENSPCTLPTNLMRVRVRLNERGIAGRSSLTIGVKCLRHEGQSGHVEGVHRITAVPISLSVVDHAGVLENFRRFDATVMEEIAKVGRNRDRIAGLRACLAGSARSSARGADGAPWSAGSVTSPRSRRALVVVTAKLSGTSLLDKGERQVFVVVEVIKDLVVRVTERLLGGGLEGGHEDSLQNVFDGEVTDVAHGTVNFGDRGKMTVDCALGVAIPAHHAGNLTGKQNSLHALVIEREGSKEGLPNLLSTHRLGRAVGVENFDGVGKRGPEILETAVKDVFKRVAVLLVHSHPSSFFGAVDSKLSRGHKGAGDGAARENPAKLDTEDLEEAVDMARNILMRLDTTAVEGTLVLWKIRGSPGARLARILTVSSAACAAAETTAGSRSVVFAVRHAAAASKSRKVDASSTTGNGKNASGGWELPVPGARSAQIRDAVSVHQESLIR